MKWTIVSLPVIFLGPSIGRATPGYWIDVRSKATSSHFWRKTKPAKIFECWGGPDEVDISIDPGRELSSQSPTGTISAEQIGKHNDFQPFIPQTVKWNSEFRGERELVVEFHQDMNAPQRTYEHGVCATERFDSKTDSISNQLTANVILKIPDNIRILRLNKKQEDVQLSTYGEIKLATSGIETFSKDSAIAGPKPYAGDLRPLQLELGQYSYFFVQPGSEIRLSLQWNTNEIKSGGFKSAIELRLIGLDGCAGIQSDLEGALDPKNIDQDMNGYIEKVACLRNPDFVKTMLYTGNGHALTKLLQHYVDGLEKWEQSPSTNSSNESKRLIPIVNAISHMTAFEITRTLLSDLYSYCEFKPMNSLLSVPVAQPIRYRAYAYNSRALSQVHFYMQLYPKEVLIEFLKATERFAKEKKTYAEVAKDSESVQILRLLADGIFDKELRGFGKVRNLLAGMENSETGRQARAATMPAIDQAERAAARVDRELKLSLLSFQASSTERVQTENLHEAIAQFLQADRELSSSLAEDMKWFLNDPQSPSAIPHLNSPFLKDLAAINFDIIKSSVDILEQYKRNLEADTTASKNGDFLKLEDIKTLRENVKQCLLHAQG